MGDWYDDGCFEAGQAGRCGLECGVLRRGDCDLHFELLEQYIEADLSLWNQLVDDGTIGDEQEEFLLLPASILETIHEPISLQEYRAKEKEKKDKTNNIYVSFDTAMEILK